ncbi:MAG: SNF2-related protein, partial [Bacteroidia bacterium]|nr:SNF2-related protein [Bacteroidia bacterium]
KKIIELIEHIQWSSLVRKTIGKDLSIEQFFSAKYHTETREQYIRQLLHKQMSLILPLLENKNLYIMDSDGYPAGKKVNFKPHYATVRFHFFKNEQNTHYYPTLRYNNEYNIQLHAHQTKILLYQPGYILVDTNLYKVDPQVDIQKLIPFTKKNRMIIDAKQEAIFYDKFVRNLIAQHDVFAKGFEITEHKEKPQFILELSQPNEHQINLYFKVKYGNFEYDISPDSSVKVELTQQNNTYHFIKVYRDNHAEKEIYQQIQKQFSQNLVGSALYLPREQGLAKINELYVWLKTKNVQVIQIPSDKFPVLQLEYPQIYIEAQQNTDWFGIRAIVKFGEFQIPLIKLRKHILNRIPEYKLPDGSVAIIPQEWFSKLEIMFQLAEKNEVEDEIRLSHYHSYIVQDIQQLDARPTKEKIRHLVENFEKIEPVSPPKEFKTELRPYQQAGLDWFYFLKKYRLGGCLADDMGLGKTIQTIALLCKEKELGAQLPSMIVMPTSLLENWRRELYKFAPHLKIIIHNGPDREKYNYHRFLYYDLILTTYGIVRNDADFLSKIPLHYLILDEAQNIKNMHSLAAQSVKKLQANYKLVLTGTPIENSTMDVYSQMQFLNPNLLGEPTFFKNYFAIPIEKNKDTYKAQLLKTLLKPFLLRRTKQQVAKDLPEKVEQVLYCEMSDKQRELYDEVKKYYRNLIFKQIEEEGILKTKFNILQGLTQLRQVANHPKLVFEDYAESSGKYDLLIENVCNLISEGHKVLVFSQFVKMLTLLRQGFDALGITYAYLDGQTPQHQRQRQVDLFQQQEKTRLFLISLKAGGVGLTLTAADYVFIVDPWWNPAVEAQAIDRAHRIGQNQTVFAYKMITLDTVEERIASIQQHKKQLIEDLIITESSFAKQLSVEDIQFLFS